MTKSAAIKKVSPSFEILLKAALFSGEAAEKAFLRWRETVDFDSLDDISYYLLPKLYQNQQKNPTNDAILKKLRGIYRRTWLENQIRIPHLLAVFKLFEENQIDFVVLSKTPFVWNLFDDKGGFSLDNFDLLICCEQIFAADKLLRKNDWRTGQNIETESYDNSFYYKSKNSVPIILRRNRNENYQSMWKTAVETEFCGTKIKNLSLNEQILYLCDTVFENDKNELWTFYFYLIFSKKYAEINWKYLAIQAERRKICFNLFTKVEYMREKFAAEIPAGFFKKLQKKAEAETAPPGKLNATLTAYRSLRKTYLDGLAENDLQTKPFGFIGFLREHWQTNSVLSVPWHIGKRFVKNKREIR